MSKMINLSVKELSRLKKIYSKVIPLRAQKFKGIEVSSKYNAGNKSGSEFFDMVQFDRDMLFILCSSSSYLTSIHAMSLIDEMKHSRDCNLEMINNFIVKFSKACDEVIDPKNGRIELLIFKLDTKKLHIKGYNFGSAQIISQDSGNNFGNTHPLNTVFMDKSYFEISLDRGQKMLALSPGILLNLNGKIHNMQLDEFIKTQLDKSPVELINELFYEMGKDRDDGLLNNDASAFTIKVADNVFIEV
jgi:hypothetical protein